MKNVGEKAGKEVVQVYVGKPESELEQPEKELVFFEKQRNCFREEQKISVHVPVKVLTSYSEEKKRIFYQKDITVFMWETVLKQRNVADSTKKKQE